MNSILGLQHRYHTYQVIHFEAQGYGMNNHSPNEGDIRYLPTLWHANPTGSWDEPPYTAYFSIAVAGFYKLQVFFKRQTFLYGSWLDSPIVLVEDENTCIEEIFVVSPSKVSSEKSMP